MSKYRFRVKQISTKQVKEAWFAPPTIDKTGTSDFPKFTIHLTENPEDALLAESESQAFFMWVSTAEELIDLDIHLLVEEVEEKPKRTKKK